MDMEWDEVKRRENLRKHGIDFADAGELFSGYTLTFEDTRGYEEQRFQTIGMVQGRVLVAVHTERQGRLRIISLRKATNNEREAYLTAF